MTVVEVYGLTPVQTGMLFHSLQDAAERDPYLNRLRFRIEGPLDLPAFEAAWQWVIARHDVLRTSFHWDSADVPLQAVHDRVDWSVGDAPHHDLSRAPLMWLDLQAVASEIHEATWTHHHLILDGWSLAAIFGEAMQRYQWGMEYEPSPPRPFREHVSWLQDTDPQPAWWQDHLAGVRPTRLRAPASPDTGWQRRTRVLPLPAAAGPTLGVSVQAAWARVLGAYCDTDDVVFGTTVSGRPADLPGAEDMVGMFINTVPVRVNLREPDLLRRVFEIQAERAAYEQVSLSALPPGLFDTLLVMENFPLGSAVDVVPGLRIIALAAEEHTNYPLTVTVIPRPDSLTVEADFRGVTASIVDGMLDCFSVALAGGELASGNHHAASPAQARRYAVNFEAATVAVIGPDGEAMSYPELEEASARVAGWLTGKLTVGVRLGRSTHYAAALLGAVRAGVPYVPADPETPAARLATMFATADAVLDEKTIAGALAHDRGTDRPVSPQAPFYTIFTSGSTGVPKGVVVPHSAIAAHVAAVTAAYELTAGDRVLHFASPAFDVAAEELFPVWAVGATVVMYPGQIPDSVAEFVAYLQVHQVTVVNLPAAYWHLWVDELTRLELPSSLRLLIVGNETVWPRQVDRWRAHAPQVRLLNAYGVTEATITTTLHEPSGPAGVCVPIGRPLAGMDVQVLNSRGMPVPPGVIGELYLGGTGVATGYLGDPAQTAARFVPAPHGQRRYRTGDLGYQSDGELVLTGRADDQVQIRGHRVEPGEVEAVLARLANRAVVLARDARLVAYVITDDLDALRARASAVLPVYLRPSDWVMLSAFPLLPNGKVDRSALPDPARAGSGAQPATATEQWLADTWSDVLAVTGPGRDDDFFALGGDSLKATQVAARARRAFSVALPLRSVLERATLAGLAREIDLLRRSAIDMTPLVPLGPDASRPLSFTQERLWFLHHLEGGANYNIPAAWQLTGALDVAAMERALTAIVARHTVLRTVFPDVDGIPVSQVMPPEPIHLVPEPWQEGLLAAAAQTPMDLASGPLLRCRLFRQAEDRHVLLVNVHHIVFDGWSHTLFLDELAAVYRGGELPGATAIEYADYAAWQRDWLQGDVLKQLLGYWTEHLAGAPQQLALPADRPRLGLYEGGSHRFHADVLPGLRAVARDGDATLFVVLLAAFNVLLYRYSRERDLIVGTPVAGRLLPETEQVIGCFFNTLALRTKVDPQSTLRDLVEAVRGVAYGGYDHQEAPFEKVVEAVTAGRALDHHPLVQVVLVLQNMAYRPLELPGLTVSAVAMPESAKLDLILTLAEHDGQLAGLFEYNAALFDAATVAAMAAAFTTLLAEFARNPDQTVGAVPLIAPAELPSRGSDQTMGVVAPMPPADRLAAVVALAGVAEMACPALGDLFAARVAATPGAAAVIGADGESLSWSTLDERSAKVVYWLRDQGVRRGDAVGLMVEHGVALTVAIWGILRAGAAYVPLDRDDPPERTAQMCADAGVRMTLNDLSLVAAQALEPAVREEGDSVVRAPDLAAREPGGEPSGEPDPLGPYSADQLAYVLFTSGSTGRPKGVAVAHRHVIAFLRWLAEDCGLGPDDRSLGHLRPGFDMSVPELLGPVVWGGATVMARAAVKTDPAYLVELSARRGVTVITATATMLQLIAEQRTLSSVTGLRLVIAGGEAVPMTLLKDLREQTSARLDGQYGPTETIVHVASWTMPTGDEPPVAIAPLGLPINGSQVHVLDAALQPVPPGAIGELCIGGIQVSCGYAASPALTASKFVPDPWHPGARLYRTGDLGRRHGGGWLEFLGRADRQIKWHGLRIEPGEIEAALLAHPQVRQAVVIAEAGRLVAFVVTPSEVDLRDHLAARVPRHMVPAQFVHVDAIARNANGKTDHAALRRLIPAQETAIAFEAPGTGTEREIAALFAEVLGVPCGRHDDFFLSGGHSLLAVRVMTRIRRDFGVDLPLRAMFEAPTVEAMATRVEDAMLADAGAELLSELLGAMEESR